ncbi:unnamed protein product [Urochloa humidicola]
MTFASAVEWDPTSRRTSYHNLGLVTWDLSHQKWIYQISCDKECVCHGVSRQGCNEQNHALQKEMLQKEVVLGEEDSLTGRVTARSSSRIKVLHPSPNQHSQLTRWRMHLHEPIYTSLHHVYAPAILQGLYALPSELSEPGHAAQSSFPVA